MKDDDEFARYLAQYLYDSRDEWTDYGGFPVPEDIYEVIKRFMEELP